MLQFYLRFCRRAATATLAGVVIVTVLRAISALNLAGFREGRSTYLAD